MMEKRGVIDDNTPGACGDGSGDGSGCAGEPTTKQAADRMADHPVTRLEDGIRDMYKDKVSGRTQRQP